MVKAVRRFLVALGFLLAWPVGVAPSALSAQDDWGLTRERRPNRPAQPRRPGGARRPRRPAGDGDAASAPASPDRTAVLIERYMRVLEADPRETFAFHRLLDLYRERDGNIDALVRDLGQRLEADGDAYAPRMLLGHIYKAQSRLDEARAAYERAASVRADASAPLVALAEIAQSRSEHARARELFDRALERTRDDAGRQDILRKLGSIALEQRDFDGARGYYDQLARGARGSVYLLTEYARALAEKNHHELAIEEYERVIQRLRGDNRVLPPVLREMAEAQLEAGRTDDAIATLDRALSLAGRAAGVRREIYDGLVEAYRRADRLPALAERLGRERSGFETAELLGRVHDELGNETEALEAYRRALGQNPRHIDTRVRVIQLLSRSGRIDEVIEEYESLIRSAPREPRFVVELAQLLMQVGRRDEALRRAEETSRRNPREPAVHQALAELYSRWGEEERAAREVQILARIEPNDPAHLVALGAQQLEAGNREQAIATWRRILNVESDRARAHATLGGVFADHDMLSEAAREYREAVQADGDRVEYVRGLANVLERLRQDDEAVVWWRRVLELAADDRAAKREARQRIVAIWDRGRRLDMHMRELAQRFGADTPDVEAGRFLAEVYRRKGPSHAADSERVLERIIEVEPGDVESLLALERVRTARGDLQGAIDVLRRLVEADPRRATTYLARMAEHALALYRDEEAVEYAAQAVERTPDDASGHRRLGDLYRARQDMERAIASYQRAIELNDRLYPTYIDLAEIHLARGEQEAADRLFRQVMRASPDDDLVARAARASIQINLGAGTLEDLERDLLPLALGHPQRPIYRKLVVELYDGLARPLIQASRGSGDAAREANEALRRLGTRAIKPLLEALADNEPSQRRVAVEILGYLGNENAAAPLLAAAEGDGDTDLRVQALAAAGAVAPATLAPRFQALAEGPERRLRGIATWGLARTGGRRSLPALRELARQGDPSVRAYAALGLGRARDGASRDALERLVREDRSIHVQAAAAWALGQLGDARSVPVLVAALRSRDGLVALAAASALGRIGDPAAREALAQALFDDEAAQRDAAARALRRVSAAPPQPPGEVATAARDRSRSGAREAEAASTEVFPVPRGTFSPGEYIATLVDVHGDDDGAVDLGPLRAALTNAARDALRGPSEQVHAALAVLSPAVSAGSREGAIPIALGPLTGSIAEWPAPARADAAEELSAMAVALLPDLLSVVRHVDADVRSRAIRVLARVSHPDATSAILAAIEDPEPTVQRAAIDALGHHDAPEAGRIVAPVARILGGHPDWSIRTEAAATLGRLARPEAVPALIGALRNDDYAFVREAAARALARISGPEAHRALEAAAQNDPEPRVRRAAANH